MDPLGLMTQSDANKDYQEKNKEKYERTRKHIDRLKAEGKTKSAGIHEKRLQGQYDKHYKRLGADGYNIYSDDFKNVIQHSTRSQKDGGARESVFIIQGGNEEKGDSELMQRGSRKHIDKFKKDGYDVNILTINKDSDYRKDNPAGGKFEPKRYVADIIRNALKNIRNIAKVQIYAHRLQDINLTDEVMITDRYAKIANMVKEWVHTSEFKITHPSANGASIDLFGCNYYEKNSSLGRNISKASGAAVREAKPGYSFAYPDVPRAQRATFGVYYDANAWIQRNPDGTSQSTTGLSQDF